MGSVGMEVVGARRRPGGLCDRGQLGFGSGGGLRLGLQIGLGGRVRVRVRVRA